MTRLDANRPERRRAKATSSVDILGFRVKRQNDQEMSCPLLVEPPRMEPRYQSIVPLDTRMPIAT